MSATGPARKAEKLTAAGLGVTRWPGGPSTAVGLPGLTSTSAAWSHLAGRLPDWTVVSPDLRGRGRSMDVHGPPGLGGHADDVARLLEELDLHDVVIVGHSMGAYLAPVVETRTRARLRALVMVDGGIPPGLPAFIRPWMMKIQFRRQVGSADRDWPSIEALAEHNNFEVMTRSRPELKEPILTMLAGEVVGEPGRLRPAVRSDIAVGDALDTFFGQRSRGHWRPVASRSACSWPRTG